MRILAVALQAIVFRPALFSVKYCLLLVLCFGFAGPGLHARQVEIEGRTYVDLATVAGRLGMESYWLRSNETYRLRSKWTTIDVGKHSRVFYLNRMPIYMGFASVELEGRLYIAQADYRHAIQPILVPQAFANRPGLKRIVIDAGHGGKDHGAENKAFGLKEKSLALDVAKRLKTLLHRNGFDVVLTRDTDHYIPLLQRSRRADQVGSDLFISIHFNAAESKKAAGPEIFALTPRYQASSKYTCPTNRDKMRYVGNGQDPWNVLLAYHIQHRLVQRLGGPNRGVKRARFVVLKELECPGVLVEMGFLSHVQTAQKFHSSAYRQRLAQSLLEGILAYRRRLVRIG